MTHYPIEELADAAAGLLTPERAASIRHHLAGCPECGRAAAALTEVSAVLAEAPTPPMPPELADRLDAAIAAESRRRASGEADQDARDRRAASARRTALGTFGSNLLTKRHAGVRPPQRLEGVGRD